MHLPSRSILRNARAFAPLAFAWFLAALPAPARPGGGGGFHGGGFHGGGFHGGNPGGFGGGHAFSAGRGHALAGPAGPPESDWPFQLAILVVLGIVLVGLLYLRRRPRWLGRAVGAAPAPDPPEGPQAALEALRLGDPGLSLQGLEERARQLADVLRSAWCSGDMRPARAFVSDGVFCRFTVQLELMRLAGTRNAMADAGVDRVTLVGAESAEPFEFVRLRIDAHARDCMLARAATPDQVAEALRRAPVEPYSEVWTLVRCKGARTRPGAGPAGGACPSCGAPLGGGEVIQCRYCRALVNSGEYDWVLAEITQLSVWHPAVPRRISGFDRLRGEDPGLAVAALEDRASFLFWKWIEACAKGSSGPLRTCATAAFQRALPPAPVLQDVAVGAIELVACRVGEGAGGLDRVEAKVLWSGSPAPGAPGMFQEHLLRLVRRTGVQSRPSFSSRVCQACGAPLGESDSDTCEYCHASVTADERLWILDGVLEGAVLA